jgi:hypothetical protein
MRTKSQNLRKKNQNLRRSCSEYCKMELSDYTILQYGPGNWTPAEALCKRGTREDRSKTYRRGPPKLHRRSHQMDPWKSQREVPIWNSDRRPGAVLCEGCPVCAKTAATLLQKFFSLLRNRIDFLLKAASRRPMGPWMGPSGTGNGPGGILVAPTSCSPLRARRLEPAGDLRPELRNAKLDHGCFDTGGGEIAMEWVGRIRAILPIHMGPWDPGSGESPAAA